MSWMNAAVEQSLISSHHTTAHEIPNRKVSKSSDPGGCVLCEWLANGKWHFDSALSFIDIHSGRIRAVQFSSSRRVSHRRNIWGFSKWKQQGRHFTPIVSFSSEPFYTSSRVERCYYMVSISDADGLPSTRHPPLFRIITMPHCWLIYLTLMLMLTLAYVHYIHTRNVDG